MEIAVDLVVIAIAVWWYHVGPSVRAHYGVWVGFLMTLVLFVCLVGLEHRYG